MSRSSLALESLPPDAQKALATLGQHLALARVRRKESQRTWAARLGVSVPTVIRLERGDPAVSMGVYATALWMLGLSRSLAEIAEPGKDLRALEADVRKARQVLARRVRASQIARVAGKASPK